MVHAVNNVTVKANNTTATYPLPWNVKNLNVSVSVGEPNLITPSVTVGLLPQHDAVLDKKAISIDRTHTHYNVNVYFHAQGNITNVTVNPADDDTVESGAHEIKLTFNLQGEDYYPSGYYERADGKLGNVDFIGICTSGSDSSKSNYKAVRSGKDASVNNYVAGDATISFSEGASKFTDSEYDFNTVIVDSPIPVTLASTINGNNNTVTSSMDSGNQI